MSGSGCEPVAENQLPDQFRSIAQPIGIDDSTRLESVKMNYAIVSVQGDEAAFRLEGYSVHATRSRPHRTIDARLAVDGDSQVNVRARSTLSVANGRRDGERRDDAMDPHALGARKRAPRVGFENEIPVRSSDASLDARSAVRSRNPVVIWICPMRRRKRYSA